MTHLHFDCFSGASGDMVLGALVDVGVPFELLTQAIGSMNLPIEFKVKPVKKNGIAATKIEVIAQDEESYRYLPDIEAILAQAVIGDDSKNLAMKIFQIVAEAEAKAHGISIDKVHFHEVGALDSIADIVGTAVGLNYLKPTRVTSSPVVVGSGMVKCAHGLMPVPAPATANILTGVPLATTSAKGELCTPTGAAILKAVVQEFTIAPPMTIRRVGYGAGTKELIDQPNVLRLMIGDVAAVTPSTVMILETNLDDCSGEIIGYTTERLFAAGAVDVFVTPIQMKKQRPGVMLSVIVPHHRSAECEMILFRETGTFGIRKQSVERVVLERTVETVSTPYGPVRMKRGRSGEHTIMTPEYEDCARVGREHNIPLRDVYLAVNSASNSLAE